jgi:hypothetical protein
MSDNAEEGIAKAQAAAAQAGGAAGLEKHHGSTIAYLDERIVVFLLAIATIGLQVLWATAKSALLLYGSLVLVILLALLWGYARIKAIERTRDERAQQAQAWQQNKPD